MRRKRERDYLFQRRGSRNWHIRFQGEKREEYSLHTSDRRQAEIIALPMIAAHRAKVLARQPRFVAGWWYEYEPGRSHVGPDGATIIATDNKELIYLNHNGAIVRTEPNGAPQYSFPTRLKEPSFELFDRERAEAPPTKNGDDGLFETYLQQANVGPQYVGEARAVWELYKSLVGKPLKDATRDDGRKLVAHFEQQGNKSATIQKKIGWLTAAVNLAISEGKLKFNAFSSIVPKRKDALKRKPFDADDIANIKRNLDRLDASSQLLVRLLATSGMRLSEAFEITTEDTEGEVRFVVVGHKTETSLRRVPLPADLLSFLPARIEGPLFQGNAKSMSKVLNKFLDAIGIADPAKVVHSFRHRAASRLRAAGCPQDVRWQLLGHEEETVAEGYGEGYPVVTLKRWVDEIGF
jgi:integrase